MMLKDFISGTTYVFRGVGKFYTSPYLWKYAALPLLIMGLAYFAVIYLALKFGFPLITELLPKPESFPAWLEWLAPTFSWFASFIFFISMVLIILLTLSAFYELCGSLIFDYLIQRFESLTYNVVPAKVSLLRNIRFAGGAATYSIMTLFWGVLLLIFSWFLPFIGQVMLVLLIGYRYGISYLYGSGFNRGIYCRNARRLARGKWAVVLGFGALAYLLLLIPVFSIFLIPGLVVGGSMIWNEELERLND